MPKSDKQKQRILLIQEYLLRSSDVDHPVSTSDLIAYLENQGIQAERKSIYSDIAVLQDYGLDIERVVGRTGGFYVNSRTFELPELKLLIDAVQSSRFLTEKKSRELIRKLCGLCSQYDERLMGRDVVVSGRVKTMNESIYYNVDALQEAIAAKEQISFRYFDLGVDGERKFRDKLYVASPYALCWSDEYYYLISYTQDHGVTHYRVDKMAEISRIGLPRVPCSDLSEEKLQNYGVQVFQMFSGQRATVRLRMHNSLSGVVYDRFGRDILLVPDGETHFIFTTQVAVSPTFLSWVMSFGSRAQILSPKSVIEACKQLCQDVLSQYEETP